MIEIEANMIAECLQIPTEMFREKMSKQQINVLCERGTAEHEGFTRVSFYHRGRRLRIVVNGQGTTVEKSVFEFRPALFRIDQ